MMFDTSSRKRNGEVMAGPSTTATVPSQKANDSCSAQKIALQVAAGTVQAAAWVRGAQFSDVVRAAEARAASATRLLRYFRPTHHTRAHSMPWLVDSADRDSAIVAIVALMTAVYVTIATIRKRRSLPGVRCLGGA